MDSIARVHELADAQDMTMYRLAQISGISMTTIRMAERRGGQRNRRGDTLSSGK